MNTVNSNEIKSNASAKKGKFLNILKKVLLYTVVAIVGICILALLYKIFEFLFVGAVLLIGWLGIGRRRWW